MFSKQLRHINRYREIAVVLVNQGFGYLIEEMDIIAKIPYHERLLLRSSQAPAPDLGERIRIVLQELGPTYIKLGQIASTRPDILPSDIIVHLEKLQDNVSAFPFEQVRQLIREELGADIEEVFLGFEPKPLAAASIGQVHLATIKSGQKVAVKLQRPGITANVETDLEILFEIARAVQSRFQWAKQYQIIDMIDEFSKSLRKELDYTVEARNTDKISIQLKEHPDFYIPNVYWDYSTKKILTTEFLQGIKVNQTDLLAQQGYDLSLIANRLAKGIFQQIFVNGFFHGDPHPGNIIVLPQEVIGFLDFGMMGRLGSDMKTCLSSLLIALKRDNTDNLLNSVLRIGIVPPQVNVRQLRNDIELFKDTYYGLPLSKISIGEAITAFFGITQKHAIRIPSDLVLVGKALLTVEGIVQKLDPDISLLDVVGPFGEKLLMERMHPQTIAESLWKIATNFGEAFSNIPQDLKELSSVAKEGRLQLDVSLREADLLVKHQARTSNRMSVSILLLAFSILMGSIIISLSITGQPSLLWRFPVVETGFFIALSILIWILYAIVRSGKL